MMWFGDHMSGWGYVLMGFGTILFWGLIVAGIVVLVHHLGRSEQHAGVRPGNRPTAEQVLDERFARGEIDEEEYRRRLDTLRAAGARSPGPDARAGTAQAARCRLGHLDLARPARRPWARSG